MAAALIRLLTLLALALMPIGMAGTPAVAQAAPMGHAMTPTGHCDEPPEQDRTPRGKMDCNAMCTALPAADTPAPAPPMLAMAPRSILTSAPFHGIEPEADPPPPKRA